MTLGAMLPAASGIDAMQTWMDTSAGNIANSNDAAASPAGVYRNETPVLTQVPISNAPGAAAANTARLAPGQGVQVSAISLGPTNGPVEYAPGNPAAGPGGLLYFPAGGLGNQLVELLMAQIGAQANTTTIRHAVSAYQSIIDL